MTVIDPTVTLQVSENDKVSEPYRQLVEIRASAATISLHATVPDEYGVTLLAVHQRAVGHGGPHR